MTNRREFIQRTVAVSAAPLILGPSVGVQAHTSPRMRPSLAVYDDRYAESRQFARAAEAQGMETHAISGDVTALWYDDLYHRWRGGAAPIAGLTGISSLFCLEQLAWKVERRVAFRVDHLARAEGRIEHALRGPEPLESQVAALSTQANWPLWSAAAIRQLPATLRRGERFTAVANTAAWPASATWEEPLATWVIALRPLT